MTRPSNEAQFKFLISCIRYSNNGKVDFGEVARECGIVSKGAAAKRYERMMKAHGIHPCSPGGSEPPAPAPTAPTRSPEKQAALKKRKLEQFSENAGAAVDDEECFTKVKHEARPLTIKDEPANDVMEIQSVEAASHPTSRHDETRETCGTFGTFGTAEDELAGYRSDDNSIFREFLQSGGFGHNFLESVPESFQTETQPAGTQPCGYDGAEHNKPAAGQSTANEVILIVD